MKKVIALFAILAALGVVVAGCGSGDSSTTTPAATKDAGAGTADKK